MSSHPEPTLTVFNRQGETCFRVRVQARASRNEIVGTTDGVLKVCLTSPPTDNRANRQLLKFLASKLRSPVSSLRLISGQKSRNKTLAIRGVSEERIRRTLTPGR